MPSADLRLMTAALDATYKALEKTKMSVDTWTQHLHAEAFADDPPCADCGCAAELHGEDQGCQGYDFECECSGYRPITKRDRQRDEPSED